MVTTMATANMVNMLMVKNTAMAMAMVMVMKNNYKDYTIYLYAKKQYLIITDKSINNQKLIY